MTLQGQEITQAKAASPENEELTSKAKQYEEYVRQVMVEFDTQTRWYNIGYYGLSIISIIGAAIVAGTLNNPEVPKIYPTVISIIVSSATGIVAFFRFNEHSAIVNSTAESIAEEINDFDLKVGKYENLDLKHVVNALKSEQVLP